MRPLLLSLFEAHIVYLSVNILKPALKAIVLSLLPGLEEPTSDEFERTHKLLDRFRTVFSKSQPSDNASHANSSDDRHFWQSFFMATISSASRRQGALAYLERNLPSMVSTGVLDAAGAEGQSMGSKNLAKFDSQIESILSPEPGLLIRTFAAGLEDEQLLIQRGFLELLVTHLPLDSMVLQKRVTHLDLELLVLAATSVVVRREMSLNRRLWLWFLGSAASADANASEPSSPVPDGLPVDKGRGTFVAEDLIRNSSRKQGYLR